MSVNQTQENSSEEVVEKKQVVSTDKVLRMIRFQPKSFAGVHEKMNLVIVFDDPAKRIIGLEGDQGQGKTSALNALYASLGGPEPKNAINAEDKTKDSELVFEKGDDKYTVRLTKGSFTVTKHDIEGNRQKMDEPKKFLQRLIGPIGLNPMDLKDMKGKDQVKWLRDLTTFSPAQLQKEEEILKFKGVKYDKRTDVNKSIKQLLAELHESGFYTLGEDKATLVATDQLTEAKGKISGSELDEVKLAETFRGVDARKKDWERKKESLEILRKTEKAAIERIKELEEQLAEARQQSIKINTAIIEAEAYVSDNKAVVEEYDKAFKDMQDLSSLKLIGKAIDDADKKNAEFNSKVIESATLSKEIEEYAEMHKQFIKSFTPKIEGFEIVVPGVEEELKREEGLYYKGRTMAMLSESEIFELYIQLLDSQNVRICIIENITSLGSKAVEQINWFVEQRGGYVFYSAMQRGQEKISVQFLDKIK